MPTYTTAANVERVLRSSADGRLRLSSQALTRIITQTSSNDRDPVTEMTISHDQISVATSFVGKKRLKFNFTSATAFGVYEIDETGRQQLFLGTGTISSSYTTPDSDFTFPAGTFSGTIATGNIVEFEFDAQISEDDVDAYIEESEVEVDIMLSEGFVGYLTTGKTRLFAAGNVPPSIALAVQYLTAYYVYTNVFRAKFKDEKSLSTNYSNRWKRRAETLIEKYAKVARRSLPRVVSFPTFVDKFGLNSVAPEPSKIHDTHEEIVRDANSDNIFEPGGITEEPY